MKSIKVSNKVYSKDFQIKSLGYDCREVDSFLDEVNENIVKLEREIESLKDQIRTLEGQKSAVEQQYKNVSMELYNAKAQNGLGDYYYEGKVVEQDYVKAIEYYSKSHLIY